ncbi:MAG: hypothetical protein EOM69_13110, partial [Clostridia bacterium]|nr:hypothetical protein [Clostridia bacterium]
MKKCFIFLLAFCLLTCSTASANSWGLHTMMLDAVTATHDWDDYTTPTTRAEIEFPDADGNAEAVAVLQSKYHSVLLTCGTAEDDRTPFIRDAVTTAVWQPGDDGHSFDALLPLDNGCAGFILVCDGADQFTFTQSGDIYRLTSAQLGEVSFVWSRDASAYLVRGGDAPDGIAWAPPYGQIHLSDFNIRLFPRSAEEADRLNRLVDTIGVGFPTRKNAMDAHAKGTLPVYSAPSEKAWRAAKGKASVSLKGPVWVLAMTQNAEGVWTCIEYGVSARTSRIGYVRSNLGPLMNMIDFANLPMRTSMDTYLTDDPD